MTPKVQFSVMLPVDLYNAVAAFCAESGRSKASVVEEALRKFFESKEKKSEN